jgi:para-aminobenzoate synthetase component 1
MAEPVPLPPPPFAVLADAEGTGRGWGFSSLLSRPFAEVKGDGRGLVLKRKGGRRAFPGNPVEALDRVLGLAEEGAPPGALWVVALGYDLRRALERLQRPAEDDLGLPWIHAFLFERRRPLPLPPGPSTLPPLPKPRGSWPSRRGFLRGVEAILEAERAGEVYEVNLTRRVEVPFRTSAWRLLSGQLGRARPAFGGLLHGGAYRLLCLSPERFLRREGDRVWTEPIKGTAPRGRGPEEDRLLSRRLLGGEKEGAELAMAVDVARNDLGRVAVPGTVRAEPARDLLTLPYVHHLYGRVEARLRPGTHFGDLLRAAFPGASVTGAPKIRAMEWIDRLEGRTRGLYCGALGWMEPGGLRFDLCLTIRTAEILRGRLFYHVGGGITVDSDPLSEWRETEAKAAFLGEAPRALPVERGGTPKGKPSVPAGLASGTRGRSPSPLER